ncbi:MAG: N(4)-(beta-N-acetylglucosaminyl)-L-asparaginase [Pirellulales bacterium]
MIRFALGGYTPLLSALVMLVAATPSVRAQQPTGSPVGQVTRSKESPVLPRVISTWNHGLAANDAAWKVLSSQGRALDAVEAGVRESEADPAVDSVGYGGRPDRTGRVTLDACIMDERGQCGSVAFLQNIKHPISVARRVMEKTPHVMLVGQGAEDFAVAEGFPRENLLTDDAKKAWEEWLKNNDAKFEPVKNIENRPAAGQQDNHDTIGMVAIDHAGNLSGACTTSGLAFKMHGRVGDSPIIGAGLYVDNEVGAASATGVGEAVIRAVGSFLVVELMRQGHSPQEACQMAVDRVAKKSPNWRDIQVGFIAINKQGEVGAYAIAPGFNYALCDQAGGNRLLDADSKLAHEKKP